MKVSLLLGLFIYTLIVQGFNTNEAETKLEDKLETLWRLGYMMSQEDMESLEKTSKSLATLDEIAKFKAWLQKCELELVHQKTWETYLKELAYNVPHEWLTMREAAILVRYSPRRRWPDVKRMLDIFYGDGKSFGKDRCFWNAMPGYTPPFEFDQDTDYYIFFDGFHPVSEDALHLRYQVEHLPDTNATWLENMWKAGKVFTKLGILTLNRKALLEATSMEILDYVKWLKTESSMHEMKNLTLSSFNNNYVAYVRSFIGKSPLSLREMGVLIKSRPGYYKRMEHEMQRRMGVAWFNKYFWPKEYQDDYDDVDEMNSPQCNIQSP